MRLRCAHREGNSHWHAYEVPSVQSQHIKRWPVQQEDTNSSTRISKPYE
jgi:starvation-inducible outer membrane lipoprotein